MAASAPQATQLLNFRAAGAGASRPSGQEDLRNPHIQLPTCTSYSSCAVCECMPLLSCHACPLAPSLTASLGVFLACFTQALCDRLWLICCLCLTTARPFTSCLILSFPSHPSLPRALLSVCVWPYALYHYFGGCRTGAGSCGTIRRSWQTRAPTIVR